MYHFDIDKCDVLDKERLNEFRQKRLEWGSWLNNKPHSIKGQLTQYFWDTVLYRTICDLIEKSAKEPKENIGFNSSLFTLLINGFYISQAITVRRLTEKNWSNPQKAIISVRRLVDDIGRFNHEVQQGKLLQVVF